MVLLVVGLCIAIMAVLTLYFTMQSLTLILTVVVGLGACILFIAAWQMAQKNIYWRLFFMYWQPFCYLVCLFVFALHILVEIIRFCFV